MAILLLHFIPAILVSYLIYRLVSKVSGKSPWVNVAVRFLLLIAAFVAFRPFFLAFIMLNPVAMGIYISAMAAFSIIRNETWQDRLRSFVKAFVVTFPIYMICAIFLFSVTVGKYCDRTKQTPGLIPVFSLCDNDNLETAKKFTRHIYHCRSAFYNPDRNTVYVTFGAETNPDMLMLFGVNLLSSRIVREIKTFTVFRGFCHPEFRSCFHLVSPKKKIRFWDDDKQKTTREYDLGKDRPRFISPDVKKPIVYIATDGDSIKIADMRKGEITGSLKMPTDSVLTVENTNRKVIATVNHFLKPYIMIHDKETGRTETMHIGLPTLWKNWGHFFHIATDPEKERVFVEASFECAIYEIDPARKKILWRLPMPIGVRDMAFDTRRGYLLAGNFINGYVYIIDVSGKKPIILDKFYAGRRLRYLNYEADTDVFLIASGNGFYVFEPALADLKGYGAEPVERDGKKDIK